jgi:predicted nicotinamide N-methyase
VRRNTTLQAVPDLPGVRLHLADDVTTVWRQTGEALGADDPALPYWAFAWVGGLAISRYLVEHPEEVEGRTVLDLATGSGLCAIVAARCGAASVHGTDIDPFAEAAVAVNARANGAHIGFSGRDLLDQAPPDYDVILAGDVCYEETMAGRMMDWLRAAARRGARVLIGDPGRTYLPRDLEPHATYEVRTSREIEASDARAATVYTIAGQA